MADLTILLMAACRPSAMERYLTVPQVADLLQLSEKTVYRLAQRGKLPGFKAGGSWRFRRKDFDAWAAEQIQGKQKKKPSP